MAEQDVLAALRNVYTLVKDENAASRAHFDKKLEEQRLHFEREVDALRKYIKEQIEEINTNLGSLESFIITITSNDTFQKIIGESLDERVKANEAEEPASE